MKPILFVLFLWTVTAGCIRQPEFLHLKVSGVEHPVISLNGTWKFSMTPPEKFLGKRIRFHQYWSDIQVPGECQMQGFAIKHDHRMHTKPGLKFQQIMMANKFC